MAGNCWNGWKWLYIAGNGGKWILLAENGLKYQWCLEMAENDYK